ncbi:chemotaxis protein CheB [Amycolatopsis acidiphila]|uniref:protein-glutamate methylesterase n=1 Tax=Amycolatopsis acidiphila TaxID=715473 RepID=A0A558A8K8_9PSEU|nr:chemotaxis protein CheB [Amycolatopsis acidiphila]TVT20595.1 chemotaxis protein CheB [Amycolatopsis acidiphila]UIJ61411.1 chemotaxis protein CheB [Amycolatopsis acidiphila]GHG77836.1 chemotaxis protein CheB [Amycolatopsis acidiphila]
MSDIPRDLVVAGASAGGVEALREFVAGLPADFPAAVLVVLHLPAGGVSSLPAILGRSGALPATSARHGEALQRGHIYAAPPDHHLLVEDGRIRLSRGPTENGHRPAIDATFRSAAQARGPGVIGVILSGALDDGAGGLSVIKHRGGLVMVQDPTEALYSGMPESALARVEVDCVLPCVRMGAELARRVREVVDGDGDDVPSLSLLDQVEAQAASASEYEAMSLPEVVDVMGPSGFSCPDCQGVLFEFDGRGTRYRCRVGHAWTAQALFEQQSQDIEHALWAALRALEEKRDLAVRMTKDAEEHGFTLVANRYRWHQDESSRAVEVLRQFLLDGPAPQDQEPPGRSA